MFKKLCKEVCTANKLLPELGLVKFTWGNVSAKKGSTVIIKPSGVPYPQLSHKNMVILDSSGKVLQGGSPSSDTPTHLRLFEAFGVGAVVHTHSTWATIMAQAGLGIVPYGTTHADYFFGEIPCTRALTDKEIMGNYEQATGDVIIETFKNLDPLAIPGVLVKNHGVFTWGKTPTEAVYNAAYLEEIAKMAYHSHILNAPTVSKTLLRKHYNRKHGKDAYYGQRK